MTSVKSMKSQVGAGGDELREVAAYLQGVADAAAAFQAGSRALVEAKRCPSVWLTGTEPSSRFEVEHDYGDVGLVALEASPDARRVSLRAVSLLPAVSSRRTLPYGAPLVSLPPRGRSAVPMSYPAAWSQRGGARLIDLEGSDPGADLYDALQVRRCTLFFPSNEPQANDASASRPPDGSLPPDTEGECWENERHSGVKLRIPQLPREWYSLTGSENA